jgi:hypothetical protein
MDVQARERHTAVPLAAHGPGNDGNCNPEQGAALPWHPCVSAQASSDLDMLCGPLWPGTCRDQPAARYAVRPAEHPGTPRGQNRPGSPLSHATSVPPAIQADYLPGLCWYPLFRTLALACGPGHTGKVHLRACTRTRTPAAKPGGAAPNQSL